MTSGTLASDVLLIHVSGQNAMGAAPLSMRCPNPACRKIGMFAPLPGANDFLVFGDEMYKIGHRQCPNPNCLTHVFVVLTNEGRLVVSYPPEVIDFDATNVPTPITEALSEAITCHANECYIAAAIMVRKTLEELCADRGAEGGNLKERIKALGTKVVLPKELLDGIDELRLLGNDAAHIESKEYDTVGPNEVEIGIEVAKEVIKAVYQMTDLVERLRSLKSQSGAQT